MLAVWCGKWKKYVVQEITNILNSKTTTTTISYRHLYKDETNGNGSNANELVGNICILQLLLYQNISSRYCRYSKLPTS